MDLKYILVLSLCSTFSWALPQRQEQEVFNSKYYQPSPLSQIPILHMKSDLNGDGSYQYAYETANKIARQEKSDGKRAEGSYTYESPEGERVSMAYTADSDGFRPQGSHMPIAPAMPDVIKRAVEQNLADEARGIFDDGQYRENQENLPAPALPIQYRV